ncbi:MAG TPA: malto-oligosyltrehalose trehalohydrolase [Pyrinomonadaceae bacterium]|jgi:maltooligosyltrehalose trehalohydrolase
MKSFAGDGREERSQSSRSGSAAWELGFGARPLSDGSTRFRVWAPLVNRLAVKIIGDRPQTIEMERGPGDVYEAVAADTGAGADYFYVINGEKERPDPVSRWQPAGVHGPSRVCDPEEFAWTDSAWTGLALKDFLIYELHTGTFTPEGTFEAATGKLAHLKRLGVTAIELMPVAQFPGGRNWGYDGAFLYAPQSTYGGPAGLKRLIDACHAEGLAVVLDVVYNHLGPEGNYLGEYAPIYSENYTTPWGAALNFDGEQSDGVRRFFIDNALYWLSEYHIDALRLDAIHRIIDIGPRHLLQELAAEFRSEAGRLGRRAWTIAESDLNDVRVIRPARECGYGLDAQWSDDFHHALHALVTGTELGYFADFGRMADLAKALSEGFVYDGRLSPFRKKSHGNSSVERPGEQFVVFIQNHDQIANAYWGDRLASLVSLEQQKLAASILLCAPNVPMLFMGQEWGEVAPFLYFTSHTDEALGRAVREGRKAEYSSYAREVGETVSALGGFADPQAAETFEHSKLSWQRLEQSPHAQVFKFYRDLIAHRKQHPCLSDCDKERTKITFDEERRWMVLERGAGAQSRAMLVANLSNDAQAIRLPKTLDGAWRLALWSGAEQYGGEASSTPPPTRLIIASEDTTHVTLAGWNAALYLI